MFAVSDENRKLMDDILRQKVAEQQVSNFYQQKRALVKNENSGAPRYSRTFYLRIRLFTSENGSK